MQSFDLVRRLNHEQLRIASVGWFALLTYVLANAGVYIYLDLYMFDDTRAFVLAGFAMWGAGYLLLLVLLQRSNYFIFGKQGGISTYFLLGILILLGVLLGLIFLIIPGLYLLIRWMPAYADALVSGGGAKAALRRSWSMTDSATSQLALALFGPAALFVIGIGVPLAAIAHPELFTTTAIVAYNVCFACSVAWFTVLGIASFGVLADRLPRIIEAEIEATNA